MPAVVNGIVKSAEVRFGGYQDTMVSLDVYVELQGGGTGMLEGHHALYLPPGYAHHRKESLLGHIIYCWLTATDAKSVKDMVGKPIRVEFPTDKFDLGTALSPCRVGHIVNDDKWFSTDEICKQSREVTA